MPSGQSNLHQIQSLCEEALADFAARQQRSTDPTLVTIGVTIRPKDAGHWTSQAWLDDGTYRRDKDLPPHLQRAVRKTFDSNYGSSVLTQSTADKSSNSALPLFFSYVASDFLGADSFRLIVWGLSQRQSPTGFTPLPLREMFHLLTAELHLVEAAEVYDVALAKELVLAGDSAAALEILTKSSAATSAVLWYYDDITRTFESVETCGVIGNRRYTVESAFGHTNAATSGIVGQVRPELDLVVYDTKDRSAWQPAHLQRWRPHDERAFRANRWRSCVAWPLCFAGRLVGAISLYSTQHARTLVPDERIRKQFVATFTVILEGTRIARQFERLAALFDEEVSRASLSVLALGYIHDIVARHEALSANLTQAMLEVDALRSQRVDVRSLDFAVNEANSDIEAIDTMIQQMRRVAREAQAPDEEGWTNAATVLTELSPFLDMVVKRVSMNRLRECRLRLDASRERLEVPLTRSRLERIVVNLVTNAAQWSASRLDLSVSRSGRIVSVECADDGIGIDPRDLPRVFDLFFTRRSAGSGLGLYLVRKFVVEAGGSVSIDSKPYAGTVVTVRVPAGRPNGGEWRR